MKKREFQRRVARAIAAAGFLTASAFAGTAQAVVFDFGAIGVGQEQANPDETDATPIGLRFVEGSGSVFTDGFDGGEPGLQVIATGQNVLFGDPDESPFAYLDGLFDGREAGLGVCQELDGDQCDPSSDDNVTGDDPTEQLTLTFNDLVAFTGITFKGESHFGVDEAGELASTETLLINDVETTFGGALATLTGIGPATTFEFLWGGGSPEQFYVGAAEVRRFRVPEPATLGILGAGIVLLRLSGRGRNAS